MSIRYPPSGLADNRCRQLDPHVLPGRYAWPSEAKMRGHVQSPKRMWTNKAHIGLWRFVRTLYRILRGQKRRRSCAALLGPCEDVLGEA